MWNNVSNIQAILNEGMLRKEFGDLDLIVFAARDENYNGKYRAAVMTFEDVVAEIGKVVGSRVYSSNAQAIAGGLVAGDLYSTSTGSVRIVV